MKLTQEQLAFIQKADPIGYQLILQNRQQFREKSRAIYKRDIEKIKARQKVYRANNPEKIKLRARIAYEKTKNDPEKWQRLKAKNKRWIADNRDKFNASVRKYYEKNKEKINERKRKG